MTDTTNKPKPKPEDPKPTEGSGVCLTPDQEPKAGNKPDPK
jgi:hypothetical protein